MKIQPSLTQIRSLGEYGLLSIFLFVFIVYSLQVIDAEMGRRRLLEDTPIASTNEDPVFFDTDQIPWWAWVRRFHLPEVGSSITILLLRHQYISDVSILPDLCKLMESLNAQLKYPP